MKVLLSGAAVSLASGLLLGSVLQPRFDFDDNRPVGPQVLATVSAPRAQAPSEEFADIGRYAGKVPDYVMGVNWKKAMAWPDETGASEARPETVRESPSPPEPLSVTRTAYETPAERSHLYPSMEGDHPSVIEVAQPEPSNDEPQAP